MGLLMQKWAIPPLSTQKSCYKHWNRWQPPSQRKIQLYQQEQNRILPINTVSQISFSQQQYRQERDHRPEIREMLLGRKGRFQDKRPKGNHIFEELLGIRGLHKSTWVWDMEGKIKKTGFSDWFTQRI